MEYGSVDFFIEFYTPIDEDKWCEGILHFEDKHCALGLVRFYYPDNNYIDKCLVELFQGISSCITSVNDGSDKRYQQPHPKERILAALYDLKQLQAVKEAEDIINEKTTIENSGRCAKAINFTL